MLMAFLFAVYKMLNDMFLFLANKSNTNNIEWWKSQNFIFFWFYFYLSLVWSQNFLSEFKFSLNPISLAYRKESDKDREILFRLNKVFNYERIITKFVF